MLRVSLRWLGLLLPLLCGMGWASGPRYVTGPPFFTGQAGRPIGWKQAQLRYFTDPGDLSANVNHAAADALVASAAAVWNVPVANITVSRGGALAEHSNGSNVYLDALAGMVFPADVMSSNAAAVPIAVIYDTDGSVTDTLLGSGASSPSACKSNAVTESVDLFDAAGYILHAILVINGRCTGAATAQQLELQYKLTRAFGRVLGLAWSQANDNVFTGNPVATYDQAMHWPLMHPVEILCGPYTYQCLPSPFTLRPDDVASLVGLYPVPDGTDPATGKQPSLANANQVRGTLTFPTGQGMAGVNVLLTRQQSFSAVQDLWVEASAVTGMDFRLAGRSPFVAADLSATGSMGSAAAEMAGFYSVPYLPVLGTVGFDNLIASTEAINPLYTGSHTVGPYGLGAVAPAGSAPPVQRGLIVGTDSTEVLNFAATDAPSVCGEGNDGTEAAPAAVSETGWWTGLLCGYGHASYVQLNVKPGRSLTVEATALDANGLATRTKAMPVLALYKPGDGAAGLPTLASAPAAFQALTAGTTTLSAQTGNQTGNLTEIRLGIADERGEGRPDFPFQGRVFYADRVEPARVPGSGGKVTIAGMGFRAGNTVLVNGVAVPVTSYGANALAITVPAMAATGARDGVAVDVEVLDRGTGAASTMSAALIYDGSGALPNGMALLSAPAGDVYVGQAAAAPFAVRVVAGDGVTPVPGEAVQFSVAAGTASFGACGGAVCSVLTDAAGTASTTVTALSTGTITVQAVDGVLQQTASLIGVSDASFLRVEQTPAATVDVGVPTVLPFRVRVFGPDGYTGLPGRLIRFSVVNGAATFSACSSAPCYVTTDSSGRAQVYVTPAAAGSITLQAADGALTQQVSFVAAHTDDVMTVVAAPGSSYVNEDAGQFIIQLMHGDGSGADYYQTVIFSAPDGVKFSACESSVCPMTTNTGGSVGTSVSASAAGTFTIQCSFGNVVQRVQLTVGTRSYSMRILSAPTGNQPVGVTAAVPFRAEVIGLDGVTAVRDIGITMAGALGSVKLNECNNFTCRVNVDGDGVATVNVTPLQAGPVTLNAVYAPMSATASFTAVAPVDVLRVVAQPGSGVLYTGSVQSVTMQLLQGDGATPDAGKTLLFTMPIGQFAISGCPVAPCAAVTDAQGMATIAGTASTAGAVTVQAAFGAVVQQVSFTESVRPDTMRLVSAPAGTVFTGVAAAVPFAVQVLGGDGTPAAGRSITLAVSPGSAGFAACPGLPCVLLADGNGLVSSVVTPLRAGAVQLVAADGELSLTAGFTAQDRPDSLRVLSAPADGSFAGVVAGTALQVQVLEGDGVTGAANRSVSLAVTAGQAALAACGGASHCTLLTDATGQMTTGVTPLAAGSVTILITDGAVTASVSFVAAVRPDTMRLVSAPAGTVFTGVAAAVPFAVQVLGGDGVPAAGRSITLAASPGSVGFAACPGLPCVLTTDDNGMVSSVVTPLRAGPVQLVASEAGLAVMAGFTAQDRPDVLRVLNAPADGSFAGVVADTALQVQVLEGDGVTGALGRGVTVTVTAGQAALAACGGAGSCTLVTDAAGRVLTGVTPTAAGNVTILIADGAVTASVSFVAAARPDLLRLVSVPADGALVGDPAALPLAVQVLAGDGVTPVAGRSLSFSVTGGAAVLEACGAQVCAVPTDAQGIARTGVTPLAAGAVTLRAADGALTLAASFNSVEKPDTLVPVSVPAGQVYEGVAASPAFAVRVLGGDGSPRAGRDVVFTVAAGVASLAPCGAASCTVESDANGMAAVTITPLQPGSVVVTAAEESSGLIASMTAVRRPDTLGLVSAPGVAAPVGQTAAAEFRVRLLLADGSPDVGQTVTFSAAGGGKGEVGFGACGGPVCAVLTAADGTAATAVTGVQAGSVVLAATVDAALGATALQVPFQVVTDDQSLIAAEPAVWIAEGAAFGLNLRVIAIENSAPAAGLAVGWTGGSGFVPAQAATDTGADGAATVWAEAGPLEAGQTAGVEACAWTAVCARLSATGVDVDALRLTGVSGLQQALAGGAAPMPVAVQVTDEAGHAVSGAAVSVYQTAAAHNVDCPALGRCPADPVISSRVEVLTSDGSGQVAVAPLVVAGVAEQTRLLFVTGTQAAFTVTVSNQP